MLLVGLDCILCCVYFLRYEYAQRLISLYIKIPNLTIVSAIGIFNTDYGLAD